MSREKIVELYLSAGPPYLGNSNFDAKERVKVYGGKWNKNEKKWEARNIDTLMALLRSDLWIPVGFDSSDVAFIIMKCTDLKGECQDNNNTVHTAPKQRITKLENGGFLFDRRDVQNNAYNPEFDTQTTRSGHTYVYVTRCKKCNILLDSRLQFGLECDCGMNLVWEPCAACLVPKRPGKSCGQCCQ
jgi:hypothetical protein